MMEDSREIVSNRIAMVPQPYRRIAITKILEIMDKSSKSNEEKQEEIEQIVFNAKRTSHYVNGINRNVRTINRLKDRFNGTRIDVNIEEEIQELNTDRIKELFFETKSILKELRIQANQRIRNVRKNNGERFRQTESDKKNFGGIKKHIAAILGATTLLGSAVAIDAFKYDLEKGKKGELAEAYSQGETINNIDKSELLKMYTIMVEGRSFSDLEFSEFVDFVIEMSGEIEVFDKYNDTMKEDSKDLTSEERYAYYKSAQTINENKGLPNVLRRLIKSKIAVAYNQSQAENYQPIVGLENVELSSDDKGNNYIKITAGNREIINKEGLFLVGLFTNENTGMKGEFIDIVDIYKKLQEKNITEEEVTTYYKAVLEFVANREMEFSKSTYRINIEEKEDEGER